LAGWIAGWIAGLLFKATNSRKMLANRHSFVSLIPLLKHTPI